MNLDTIGCVWTGEFDLNTLRVDGEIFESGEKKLRIQKYPDTCVLCLIKKRRDRKLINSFQFGPHLLTWTFVGLSAHMLRVAIFIRSAHMINVTFSCLALKGLKRQLSLQDKFLLRKIQLLQTYFRKMFCLSSKQHRKILARAFPINFVTKLWNSVIRMSNTQTEALHKTCKLARWVVWVLSETLSRLKHQTRHMVKLIQLNCNYCKKNYRQNLNRQH